MTMLRPSLVAALVLGSPLSALAQTPTAISVLPSATALAGTEALPLVQSGATKQTPVSAFTTFQSGALPVFTSSAKGFAPASGGGTTNFLRADGTWAAPPSGGGGSASFIAPGYVSGQWYRSGPYATAGSLIGTFDTYLAQPILINQAASLTATSLGVRVTTGQTGSQGLHCLYANANGRPTGNLLASVTLALATSANNATATFSSPQTFSGVVWDVAIYNNVTTQPTTINVSTADPVMSNLIGVANTGTLSGNVTGLAGTAQAAPFANGCPATAPTGLTPTTIATPLVNLLAQ